jgi:hypothetical protein
LDPRLVRELAPGAELAFPKILAVLARTDSGELVVRTVCIDCHKPRTLSCRGGDDQEIWPDRTSMLFADMIVCPDCQEMEEARREARRRRIAEEQARRRAEKRAAKTTPDDDDAEVVDGEIPESGERMAF